MCIDRNILGVPPFPPCYFDRGMSETSEKLVKALYTVGILLYIHFGDEGAFLLMFYMGKQGKTSKIACYRDLNPLNGVFGLILYPIPWGALLETFKLNLEH